MNFQLNELKIFNIFDSMNPNSGEAENIGDFGLASLAESQPIRFF